MGGGPYALGWEVIAGRDPLTLEVYDCVVNAGDARGLGWGISLRI
jgi:hypothetical protein